MKTESRVSGGGKRCYLLRGCVLPLGAPRAGGELTLLFLSWNTFHLLLLRKFLLPGFHNVALLCLHSRGGDKIQQLHQLPAVPQWEKN